MQRGQRHDRMSSFDICHTQQYNIGVPEHAFGHAETQTKDALI
jgi:hypothetical protein